LWSWITLGYPIFSCIVNCVGYVILRRGLKRTIGLSIIGGWALGLATVSGLSACSPNSSDLNSAEYLLCQILTYLCFAFCFWVFLNLNLTSLRIRIVRHLFHKNGSATLADLLVSYSDSERFERRISRLAKGGQIEMVDGRWKLRSSVLLNIGRSIELIRVLMGRS
jgi:hypothetical protein